MDTHLYNVSLEILPQPFPAFTTDCTLRYRLPPSPPAPLSFPLCHGKPACSGNGILMCNLSLLHYRIWSFNPWHKSCKHLRPFKPKLPIAFRRLRDCLIGASLKSSCSQAAIKKKVSAPPPPHGSHGAYLSPAFLSPLFYLTSVTKRVTYTRSGRPMLRAFMHCVGNASWGTGCPSGIRTDIASLNF